MDVLKEKFLQKYVNYGGWRVIFKLNFEYACKIVFKTLWGRGVIFNVNIECAF